MRLLGLLLQLREQGHTVSLLFRGKSGKAERSPPTSELYRIIGGPDLVNPLPLGGSAKPRQPPAIYELVDLQGLATLAEQGWFDVVLCSFWFWRDPAPSAAELLLPTLAMHAPRGRRPFVAVLSDDAHSAKAAMMAEWEPSEERRAMWREKMRSLPPRQHSIYSLADAVVHISESDSRLERAAFNGTTRAWLVVRMSLRSFTRDDGAASALSTDSTDAISRAGGGRNASAPRVGFVGNGVTPTNHLAIEWFLDQVWPELRRKQPALRLRLVGQPPDDRGKRLHGTPCRQPSATRCGWAWGTSYAGREAESGVDALGFLSEGEMLAELVTWRAMAVPILRSTGVNTKLLPALQWGVPIVLTAVAAAPLAIPTDDSVALIADDGPTFARQLLRVLADPSLWLKLSSSSSAHWHQLLAADREAADVSELMALACSVARVPEEGRPLALPHAPRGAARRLVDDLGAARQHPRSRCFPQAAPAVLVALHGASAGEGPALWLHQLWEGICRHCDLHCEHTSGGRRPRRNWDVLVEHELTLEPGRLARAVAAAASRVAPRALKVLHFASPQWQAALHYFERGAALTSTVMSESSHAHLGDAFATAGLGGDSLWLAHLSPLANASSAETIGTLRSMLNFLGVEALEGERLMLAATDLLARFTRLDPSPQWLGCFLDSSERDLPDGPRAFGHTSQACAAACTAYPYFALQGGGQCFCGRSYGSGANHSRVPDTKCGHICPGEDGKMPARWCGGGWRNAVFAQPSAASASSSRTSERGRHEGSSKHPR